MREKTKQKNKIVNERSAVVWDLFEQTGNVGYYLLYKRITKD